MKNMVKHFVKRAFVICLLVVSFSFYLNAQNAEKDYSKETARASQDWIKDAVVYQIFPRQYSAKGDFNSITADLGRLQKMGVDIIWLMPIHPIGELKKKGTIGSPYAVRDFYDVNPRYGSKEDFKRLVREAHKRNLKVIIDIVANHTAWDSVMMKNPDFYTKDKDGKMISPVPDWADVADLNYENPELRKYMIEVLKFWVRDFDVDGFRCDVAGFVPTSFWEEARREVDKVKKDTFWLAEWHEPDLLVNAFNADYSWSMHSALDEVLHGKKPARHIRETWEKERARFPKNTLHMRFTDNHDERRAIARFGEKGALAGQALAFTIDGIPLVYNGMEVGDTTESGAPALFEKLPIYWDIKQRRPEFPMFYDAMIKMRKGSVALRRGETMWVSNSDEERILTFVRKTGNEEILVAINMTSAPFFGSVEARGNFEEITPKKKKSSNGLPVLSLDSFGFRIFKKK